MADLSIKLEERVHKWPRLGWELLLADTTYNNNQS